MGGVSYERIKLMSMVVVGLMRFLYIYMHACVSKGLCVCMCAFRIVIHTVAKVGNWGVMGHGYLLNWLNCGLAVE